MREEEILGATDKVRALEEQSAKTAGTSHLPNVCCAPRSLAFWYYCSIVFSFVGDLSERGKEMVCSVFCNLDCSSASTAVAVAFHCSLIN